MKYPKAIYECGYYWMITSTQKPSKEDMRKYTYHGFVYKGCAEYIHWWQTNEGKWRCMKIYLEEGNILMHDWKEYLKTGKQPDMREFEEW